MLWKYCRFVLAVSLLNTKSLFAAFADVHPASDTGSTAPPSVCPALNPAAQTETEDGIYLGNKRYDGLTYSISNSESSKALNISIDIKTRQKDGIIFYATGFENKDFFGIYLKNSKLHCTYSCDDSVNSYSVGVPVNDGTWHTVRLSSVSGDNRTQLNVDDTYIGRTSGCKKINITSPYYIGAVPSEKLQTAKIHLEGVDTEFVGCVRNIQSSENGQQTPSTGKRCPINVESGAYFSSGSSYLTAYDRFSVGKEMLIKLEIRPRNASGLLVMVHSEKDFLILQLVNGEVKFIVDSGNGPVVASFQPPSPVYFCDNRWHSITAYKIKNVILLTVDGKSAPLMIDSGPNISTDTNHPLYIGGYPTTQAKLTGIETDSQYTGCIKNVEINEENLNLLSTEPHGPVTINMCPTF